MEPETGVEPATSSLQVRRSTNWATLAAHFYPFSHKTVSFTYIFIFFQLRFLTIICYNYQISRIIKNIMLNIAFYSFFHCILLISYSDNFLSHLHISDQLFDGKSGKQHLFPPCNFLYNCYYNPYLYTLASYILAYYLLHKSIYCYKSKRKILLSYHYRQVNSEKVALNSYK